MVSTIHAGRMTVAAQREGEHQRAALNRLVLIAVKALDFPVGLAARGGQSTCPAAHG
jgi:hypothetical protein